MRSSAACSESQRTLRHPSAAPPIPHPLRSFHCALRRSNSAFDGWIRGSLRPLRGDGQNEPPPTSCPPQWRDQIDLVVRIGNRRLSAASEFSVDCCFDKATAITHLADSDTERAAVSCSVSLRPPGDRSAVSRHACFRPNCVSYHHPRASRGCARFAPRFRRSNGASRIGRRCPAQQSAPCRQGQTVTAGVPLCSEERRFPETQLRAVLRGGPERFIPAPAGNVNSPFGWARALTETHGPFSSARPTTPRTNQRPTIRLRPITGPQPRRDRDMVCIPVVRVDVVPAQAQRRSAKHGEGFAAGPVGLGLNQPPCDVAPEPARGIGKQEGRCRAS